MSFQQNIVKEKDVLTQVASLLKSESLTRLKPKDHKYKHQAPETRNRSSDR